MEQVREPTINTRELEACREQVARFIQDSLQPAKHLLEEGALDNIDEEITEEAQNFEIFEHQLDAWAALWDVRQAGDKKALVHLATGLGKTSVAVFDVIKFREEFKAEHGREPRILFTCHQNEIIEQAAERFEAFIPDLTQGFYAGTKKERDADLTFATLQSLHRSLDSFGPEEFDYIIYDEAHHSKAETFESVVNHFNPAFQLALTATPDRLDEENIRELFGHEIYSKGLAQALAEGLLAAPDYHIAFDDAVKNAMESGFEATTLRKLNELFRVKPRNEVIAQNIKDEMERIGLEFGSVKTIVFCQDIDHATEMAKLLDGQAYHSGITNKNKRRKLLEDFRDGTNQVICTRDMFNEGVDIPDARLLVFLRSTSSQTIFEQQLGRGLRKAKGKDTVSVLDFVANVERIAMVRELADSVREYVERDSGGGYRTGEFDEAEHEEMDGLTIYTGHGDFDFDRLMVDLLDKFEALRQNDAPIAPDDYLSLNTAARELGVTHKTLSRIVEELGWELPLYKFNTQVTRGVSGQQIQQLREVRPDIFSDPASEEFYSINSASRAYKIGPKVLEKIIDELGWDLPLKKFGPKTVRAISVSQLEGLRKSHPDAFASPVPEGFMSIKGVAQKLGVDFYTVKRIVEEEKWDLPRYKFRGGVVTGALNEGQIEFIGNHPRLDVKKPDESTVSVAGLAHQLGVSGVTIRNIMNDAGIEGREYAFGKGGTKGVGLSKDEVDLIKANIVPPMPEDWVRLSTSAKQLGVKIMTVRRIIADLDISLEERMANGKKGFAISPEQLKLIKESDRYKRIVQRREKQT